MQAKRFEGILGYFQTRLHSLKTVTADCLMQQPRSSNHSHNRAHFSIISTINAGIPTLVKPRLTWENSLLLTESFSLPSPCSPNGPCTPSSCFLFSQDLHQGHDFLSLPTNPGWPPKNLSSGIARLTPFGASTASQLRQPHPTPTAALKAAFICPERA